VISAVVDDFVAGRLEPGPQVLRVADGSMRLTTSGQFMDDRTLESVARAEAGIGDGRIEVPLVPAGELAVPPGVTETTLLTVVFDGQRCQYDGPPEVSDQQIMRIEFRNDSSDDALLNVSLLPQLESMLDLPARPGHLNSGHLMANIGVDAYGLTCLADPTDPSTAVPGSEVAVGLP
jgi:hypothetical protein